MKRRRQLLQVSTFPFLAVLLCALGALILILLMMDRKAKLAALQKGQEQQRQQVAKGAKAVADRVAVNEARVKAARAAWERKREALRQRLDDEEKSVQAELARVRARLDDAARKLGVEERHSQSLRERLQSEKGAVAIQEQELAAARRQADEMAGRVSAAEGERARLAAMLTRLEQQLKDVRLAREKETPRYSVVPYFGRQGEGRRPLYVECAAEAVVFHPDKKEVTAGAPRGDLRAEVERRLADQKKVLRATGAEEVKPYLMLLVRPAGVPRYYEMQAVAHEMSVDFGYELVDAGWKLDYPAEAPSRAEAAAPPLQRRGGVAGMGQRTAPQRAPDGGDSSPARGAAASIGSPAGGAPTTVGTAPGEAPAKAGRVRALVGLSRPQPFGGEGTPAAGGTAGSPAPAAPAGEQGPPAGLELSPELPSPASTAQPRSTPDGAPAQGAPPAVVARGDEGPTLGPAQPSATPQREVRLRPAAISADVETVIYVECRRDLALIYPTGRRLAIDALNHSPAHNPLLRAVKEIIARRQAMAAPGGPAPRVVIRFLVHRDGVETYHLAYPALGSVAAEKKAHWLRPEDDVRKIIERR